MAKYKVLDLFYKSKEWQNFRTAYIGERLIFDGGSRCDYCGAWIDNPDDIALHHIVELNPDNVADANIALNPDKIKQVHKTCHNSIHKHAKDKEKRVYIIYGPPCVGKKTYVKQRMWPGDLVVDIDKLYKAIANLKFYNKPMTLYYNVTAVQNLLLDHIKTRYGNWDNAWVIGGYADKYKREKAAQEIGAELIYIHDTKEGCMERLRNDPKRKENVKEWEGYIDKWFESHT